MKKIISVLLAAMMLLCCLTALAEGEEQAQVTPAYQVKVTVPEGYEASDLLWETPFICDIVLVPTAEGKPSIMVVISYNDAFSDITFNAEMSSEDFDARAALVATDEETGEEISYEVRETGLGTKVIQLNHEEGYTEFYTIWRGYEVSLDGANFDEENVATPLTEEQIAEIMQFLTDLDMTTVIEEVAEPAA